MFGKPIFIQAFILFWGHLENFLFKLRSTKHLLEFCCNSIVQMHIAFVALSACQLCLDEQKVQTATKCNHFEGGGGHVFVNAHPSSYAHSKWCYIIYNACSFLG